MQPQPRKALAWGLQGTGCGTRRRGEVGGDRLLLGQAAPLLTHGIAVQQEDPVS